MPELNRDHLPTPRSLRVAALAVLVSWFAAVVSTTLAITRGDWSLAINARHADCLRRAGGFTEAARGALTSGLSPEFIAEELRGALDAVGEIVGKADSEEILGKIFSTFCIGK